MSLSLPMADDRVALTGQLKPADMQELAAAGFVVVINNRPDRETMFGQPRTADLDAAIARAKCRALGLPGDFAVGCHRLRGGAKP